MTAIHVTEHAVDRYCERVANVPRDVVRARLLAAKRGILCAARFGAQCVLLHGGVRLIIEADDSGVRILTVLGPGQYRRVAREAVSGE